MHISAVIPKILASNILRGLKVIYMNCLNFKLGLPCFLSLLMILILFGTPLFADEDEGYEFKSKNVAMKKELANFYSSIRDIINNSDYEFTPDQSLFNACHFVCDKSLFIKSHTPIFPDTISGFSLSDIFLENGVTDRIFVGFWADHSSKKEILKYIEQLRKRNNNRGKLFLGVGKSEKLSKYFITLVFRNIQFDQCRKKVDQHILNQIILKSFLSDPNIEITVMNPAFKCEKIEAEPISKDQYIINYPVPAGKGHYIFSISIFNGLERIESNVFPVFVECSKEVLWRENIRSKLEKKKIDFISLDRKYISQSSQDKAVFDFFNDLRKKFGLNLFNKKRQLSDFSEVHCRDMAENNFFSHYSDIRGGFLKRLMNISFQFSQSSEIIARSKKRSSLLQRIFFSPLSVYNLLNSEFNYAGVSVQRSAEQTFFLSGAFFKEHNYISSTGSAEIILKSMNQKRKEYNLKPLIEDYSLSKVALKHCKYMSDKGYPVIKREKPNGSISADIKPIRKNFGKLKLQVWHCSEPGLPEIDFYNKEIYDTFGLGIIHSKSINLGPVYFGVLILGQKNDF